MRFVILTILFLIPLLGFASFPIGEDLQIADTIIINGKIYVGTDTDSTNMFSIEKETTEITKKLSNQSLDSKKPWYNTWWAILLNIILLIPFSAITALLAFIALFLRLSKLKNFWKWFFIISSIAGTILIIFLINVLNELG
tara:strand:- start:268 stop:690 length:423 start_codon:yes stop_codon:yes gene_type:complete